MTVYKVGRQAEVRRGGGAKKVTFKKQKQTKNRKPGIEFVDIMYTETDAPF